MSDNANRVFGAIAYRYSSEPFVENRYETLVKEYIYNGVREHLGLTVQEYIDTPVLQREQYNKVLLEVAEEKQKQLEELEQAKADIEGGSRE